MAWNAALLALMKVTDKKSMSAVIDEFVTAVVSEVDGMVIPLSSPPHLLPSLPNAEEGQRVYDMLRDDDLSELFLRRHEHLRVLINEESIPSRTRRTSGYGH